MGVYLAWRPFFWKKLADPQKTGQQNFTLDLMYPGEYTIFFNGKTWNGLYLRYIRSFYLCIEHTYVFEILNILYREIKMSIYIEVSWIQAHYILKILKLQLCPQKLYVVVVHLKYSPSHVFPLKNIVYLPRYTRSSVKFCWLVFWESAKFFSTKILGVSHGKVWRIFASGMYMKTNQHSYVSLYLRCWHHSQWSLCIALWFVLFNSLYNI